MALQIIRFNERYYYEYDEYYDEDEEDEDSLAIGIGLVYEIPCNPKPYKAWLDKKRAKYAEEQRRLDRDVFPIRYAGPKPLTRLEYTRLPTAIPRPNRFLTRHVYTTNLDREVFSVDFGAHFALPSNILQRSCLHALLVPSSMSPRTTMIVCREICPDKELGSPAVELPGRDDTIAYRHLRVKARRGIQHPGQFWLMRLLAEVSAEYATTLVRFGREWGPESLPFRELIFAILWIASGKSKCLSFPAGVCNPWTCWKTAWVGCEFSHRSSDMPTTGWFDQKWAGSDAPLLEFGSFFHRSGDSPGVSPAGTMYWLDDVLVSLALEVDGAAVTKAVTWGIEQGRRNFQLVVISLFEVILAEVSTSKRGPLRLRPFVRVSSAIRLSDGVRKEDCLSMHQRERAEREKNPRGAAHFKFVRQGRRSETEHYPGFAALVNFFDVAATRRSAVKSTGALPTELYCRILDHVDYNTWRACSTVSPAFRAYCFLRYRVDNDWTIVPGPLSPVLDTVSSVKPYKFMSFHAEHLPTGLSKVMVERDFEDRCCVCLEMEEWNRMPIIGEEPRALMASVMLEFEDCCMEPFKWSDGRYYTISDYSDGDISTEDLE